jgi:hypothetical protein
MGGLKVWENAEADAVRRIPAQMDLSVGWRAVLIAL